MTTTATATYAVRVDPPYEDADGGSSERQITCSDAGQLRRALLDLTDPGELARLDAGQVPMLVEIRRLT